MLLGARDGRLEGKTHIIRSVIHRSVHVSVIRVNVGRKHRMHKKAAYGAVSHHSESVWNELEDS